MDGPFSDASGGDGAGGLADGISAGEGTAVRLEIAGIGSRSYAFVVDWHLRVVLALAWLAGAGFLISLLAGTSFAESTFGPPGTLAFYGVLLPSAAIYLLYHPVLETLSRGRTPGKRYAGVRIVTGRGAVPGVGALLVRNVFRIVDSLPMFYLLGLGVVLFTRNAVRIGDLAADTVLVHERGLRRDAFGASAIAGDSVADFRSRELARDLLARWRELAPSVRARLAARLLEEHGARAAARAAAGARDADEALRRELSRFAAGGGDGGR